MNMNNIFKNMPNAKQVWPRQEMSSHNASIFCVATTTSNSENKDGWGGRKKNNLAGVGVGKFLLLTPSCPSQLYIFTNSKMTIRYTDTQYSPAKSGCTAGQEPITHYPLGSSQLQASKGAWDREKMVGRVT